MRKVSFFLSKFSGREHVVPKLIEIVTFRDAAKFGPTLGQHCGRRVVPRSPLGRSGTRRAERMNICPVELPVSA